MRGTPDLKLSARDTYSHVRNIHQARVHRGKDPWLAVGGEALNVIGGMLGEVNNAHGANPRSAIHRD